MKIANWFLLELDLEFFTNNVALVFLIIVSGALLLFPKILGANQKVISAKDSVILMNQENIIILIEQFFMIIQNI